MNKCKYIMVDVNGIEAPIVFPGYIDHGKMAAKFQGKVGSAGFVAIGGTVRCHGKSLSLDIESAPGDSDAIKYLFGVGMSEEGFQMNRKIEALESQVVRLQKQVNELSAENLKLSGENTGN